MPEAESEEAERARLNESIRQLMTPEMVLALAKAFERRGRRLRTSMKIGADAPLADAVKPKSWSSERFEQAKFDVADFDRRRSELIKFVVDMIVPQQRKPKRLPTK